MSVYISIPGFPEVGLSSYGQAKPRPHLVVQAALGADYAPTRHTLTAALHGSICTYINASRE
jgi:hypothetical protein